MRPTRLGVALLLAACPLLSSSGVAQEPEWHADWAVRDSFRIEVDARGFDMPTALAFIPRPGPDPEDPLYFVTELRGRVAVVSNDRSVVTFADDFVRLEPEEELPSLKGEVGLAGICLDPPRGYVFVTFVRQDSVGALRNTIVRFQSEPGRFSTEPSGSVRIGDEVLSRDVSAVSHQIGPCLVQGEHLYVGVGDGERPGQSRRLDTTLGKILRMTLDGRPAPGNPFVRDADAAEAASYIWAYGFRNPFSLALAGGRLFVADNGPNTDRFMEVVRGRDYLWDGTDFSIGTGADVVLAPSVGPVQMDFYDGSSDMLPERYDSTFFIATSGLERGPPLKPGGKAVLAIRYDLAASRPVRVPETLLRYRGDDFQTLVGLAMGPDGLYFAPLFPVVDSAGAILKAVHSPEASWPWDPTEDLSAGELFMQKGCVGCHKRGVLGASTVGPSLDRADLWRRVRERVLSEAYLARLDSVDAIEAEPFRSTRDARDSVRQAQGDERVRKAIYYRILEPRFDSPAVQMPDLELTDREARIMTEFLLGGEAPRRAEPPSRLTGRVYETLRDVGVVPGTIRFRHLLLYLVVGGCLGVAFAMAGVFLVRRRTSR